MNLFRFLRTLETELYITNDTKKQAKYQEIENVKFNTR